MGGVSFVKKLARGVAKGAAVVLGNPVVGEIAGLTGYGPLLDRVRSFVVGIEVASVSRGLTGNGPAKHEEAVSRFNFDYLGPWQAYENSRGNKVVYDETLRDRLIKSVVETENLAQALQDSFRVVKDDGEEK